MTSPYYQDDAVTIYHGRCEDVLPTLTERVDMVFTSPPYNLGVSSGGGFADVRKDPGVKAGKWSGGSLAYGYDDHADDLNQSEYEVWQRHCIRLMWESLTDSGAVFYNHKPRVQNGELWTPLTLCVYPVRQIVIWSRSGGVNFAPTHYCPTHEWIVILAKPQWRLKSKAASGVGDVWYVPQRQSEHPAPFPIGLPARAIESVAPRSVLDPFMGSGTTLRAAKDAGIRCIGVESSERWCEFAATRCAQEVLAIA